MKRDWWDRPVRVLSGPSTAVNVSSVTRAAEFLMDEWPKESGAGLLRARRAVLRSLGRPDDPGTRIAARMAFEAAAREADILVER